jgi:hypothetical protein
MSFYNVLNPAIFNIYKPDQTGLIENGKLGRIASSQLINGGLAQTTSFSVTAEQLIGGNIIVNAGATGSGYAPTGSAGITMTLPSAQSLIQLLMGPGGFDVSNNDIFILRVQNISSTYKLYIAPGAGGSVSPTSYAGARLVPPFPVCDYYNNSPSSTTVSPYGEIFISIQLSISGSTYEYTLI